MTNREILRAFQEMDRNERIDMLDTLTQKYDPRGCQCVCHTGDVCDLDSTWSFLDDDDDEEDLEFDEEYDDEEED